MSNGAIPKQGKGSRSNMAIGLQHHVRDAMQVDGLARAGGGIFITNEVRAFGKPGDPRRREIERLCTVQIMSVDEFCTYCEAQRAEHDQRRYRVVDEGDAVRKSA